MTRTPQAWENHSPPFSRKQLPHIAPARAVRPAQPEHRDSWRLPEHQQSWPQMPAAQRPPYSGHCGFLLVLGVP